MYCVVEICANVSMPWHPFTSVEESCRDKQGKWVQCVNIQITLCKPYFCLCLSLMNKFVINCIFQPYECHLFTTKSGIKKLLVLPCVSRMSLTKTFQRIISVCKLSAPVVINQWIKHNMFSTVSSGVVGSKTIKKYQQQSCHRCVIRVVLYCDRSQEGTAFYNLKQVMLLCRVQQKMDRHLHKDPALYMLLCNCNSDLKHYNLN